MFRKSRIFSPLFKKKESVSNNLFAKGTGGNVNLHDALKSSYADDKTKQNFADKNGYIYDKQLSSHNQSVFFHPEQKKLLVSVAGTHNISDVGTDAMLMGGKLKDTKRYKEAQSVLSSAKNKYGVGSATVIGHSLGGSIASAIGSSSDKIHTLDKGQTVGNTTRQNEKAYRNAGDAVSLLGANRGIKTIGKGNVFSGGILGALKSHDIGKIKDSNILI